MGKQNNEAVEAAFKEKVADLLDRRKMVRETMANLTAKERSIDRELADLRGAARVFGIELNIPPDEDLPGRIRYVTRPDGVTIRQRVGPEGAVHAWQMVRAHNVVPGISQPVPTPPPDKTPSAQISKRPPVRELVLDLLREAGEKGAQATPMRQHIKRVYNTDLHSKTVGMTLYRLSLDGLVRREGRTWFLVPPIAETKNPGVGAPGSESSGK